MYPADRTLLCVFCDLDDRADDPLLPERDPESLMAGLGPIEKGKCAFNRLVSGGKDRGWFLVGSFASFGGKRKREGPLPASAFGLFWAWRTPLHNAR